MKLTKSILTILALTYVFVSFSQTNDNSNVLDALITDRPDATESPNTVAKGFLQIETGGFFEGSEDGLFDIDTYVLNTTLVRLGLLDNLELRVGWDFIEQRTSFNGVEIPDILSGYTPLLLGVKVGITEEKGILPQIGLIGHIFLPFTAGRDFRPETTGANFLFAFAHTLNEKSSLSYNLGGEILDGNAEFAYVYSISYGYSFTDRLGGYAELYGDFPEDSSANHLWDAGLTYLISDNVQLDATVGSGITDGQDILLSAGVSFRIPVKKQK